MAERIVFLAVLLPWLNPFSPGPTPSVGPLLFSWACVGLALLAWAAPTGGLAPTRGQRAFLAAWLWAALISAVMGVLQYLNLTTWALGWINHTSLGEAYGNLRQRNQFASLINLGLVVLVLQWAALHDPKSEAPYAIPAWLRTGFFVYPAACLLGLANAASASRTGLLQLLMLVLLLGLWRRQRAVWALLGLALAAFAVGSVALPLAAGLDPMQSGAWARLRAGDALCFSRLTLWRNVLTLIALKPWTGWGWGELDYAHFMTLYPGARFCDILDNAHNLPLHLAVELGLPVALVACAVLLALLWRARPWRAHDPLCQTAWAVLAVIGLHSLLEYPLWYGPFQMAVLGCLVLLASARRDATAGTAAWDRATSALRPVLCGLGVAIGLGVAAAAWQYHLASQVYLDPEERDAAYRDKPYAVLDSLWLFRDQVRFAELTITEIDASNAAAVLALGLEVLHFSPEPRVIEAVLDSARLLGEDDVVQSFVQRYRAAFPKDYAAWVARQR
ncbi:MAG: hypothetical protein OHK0048_08080 [Rhodoferax sp.]